MCDGFGCREIPATSTAPNASETSPDGGIATDATTQEDAAAPCDGVHTTCPCSTTAECTGALQCIDGLCLTPCEFSSQCGTGRICANGMCVVGCDANTPCADGYTCIKSRCQPDEAHPQCSESVPCTGGLQCVQGLCQGACTSHEQCAAGEICSASTGTCIDDPQPKAPCEQDASLCSARQVCQGGYCRFACSTDTECRLIDARIPVCSQGVCMSEIEANPQCTSKDECGPGQDCVSNRCI